MPIGDDVRILSLKPESARFLSETEMDDLLSVHNPDIIFVVGDASERSDTENVVKGVSHSFDGPMLYPSRDEVTVKHYTINNIDIVATDADHLQTAIKMEQNGYIEADGQPVLVTNDLGVEMDMTELTANISPQEPFEKHATKTERDYIYLTGKLDADYQRRWGEIVVRGCAPMKQSGSPFVPCLSISADGKIARSVVRETSLGLRAMDGIGSSMADKLQEAGFSDRQALANATRKDLRNIHGIGQKTANLVFDHCRAMENNRVIRTSSKPLPGKNPIFVGMYADAPDPRVVWLLGGYDPSRNRHKTFIAREPGDMPRIVKLFNDWLDTYDDERILVAWKGRDRVFKQVARLIPEYVPEFIHKWDNRTKLDLYDWCIERDNARLPAREDRLLDAATALGYEQVRPDITRERARETYRRWIDREEAPEPDWSAFRDGLADELSSLATVYDGIENAAIVAEAV